MENNNVFFEGKTKCDEAFYKETIKIQFSSIIIPWLISFIISIFLLIGICISKNYYFLAFPIAIIIFLIVGGLVYYFKLTKLADEALKSQSDQEVSYHFTIEHFYGEAVSSNSKLTFDKKYDEIKKVLENKKYIYIFFDVISIAIDKALLADNQYQVLLSLLNKKQFHKQKNISYYSLICLFMLTLISPIISVIFIALACAFSDIPQFTYLTFKYSYIFAIFLIIPIASIICYFIFRKKYRCKKNLISGIIIAIFLGLFSLMSNQYQVRYDDSYLLKVEENMNYDFPNNPIINYVILDKKDNFEMMIKYDNKNDLEQVVNSLPFQTDLNSEVRDSLEDISTFLLLYDQFLTYDIESKKFNEPIISYGYMIAYDESDEVIDIQSVFKI